MGYLKTILETSTWVCPMTGSYKIICVAGGAGGSKLKTPGSPGGSTSFGEYVTASGTWGSTIYATGNSKPGMSGYTLMNYMDIFLPYDDSTSVNNCNIGYGAGGAGLNAGGAGRLNIGIVNLKKNDTIACIVGAGGLGDNNSVTNSDVTTDGNQGIIVIQYLGNDGWLDAIETDEEYTINLYVYGELKETKTIRNGQSISLPLYSNVQPDDTVHCGWTLTEGDKKIIYKVGDSFVPMGSMDLHAVYSYTSDYAEITETYNGPGDEVTTTVDYDGTLCIGGYMTEHVYGRPSGTDVPDDAYVDYTNTLSYSIGNNSYAYVKLNGIQLNMSLSKTASNINKIIQVKAGDTLSMYSKGGIHGYITNNGSSTAYGLSRDTTYYLTVTYPKYGYGTAYRSKI